METFLIVLMIMKSKYSVSKVKYTSSLFNNANEYIDWISMF